MNRYRVTLTGRNPLLCHNDDIDWADHMETWKNDPANKKMSRAGDDRPPAWRWLGCLYHEHYIGLPAANLMRSFMEGGAMVPVPGGKSGKTFKSQTQSGMMIEETLWPLLIGDAALAWSEVESLKDVHDFSEHRELVRALGFELNIKRAKIGTSKHIRVRPQFNVGWRVSGTIAVWDEQITLDALTRIIEYAGFYKGLGDWRPGGRTPGAYGTFNSEIALI